MRPPILLLLAPLPILLGACVVEKVAETAVDVVSLPVKAVGAGVNALTPSQRKADEARGRKIIEAEREAGRNARLWEDQCRKLQAEVRPCPPPPPGANLSATVPSR
ncbi:hypothetical protein ABDK56_07685 [Sphingomonas sp. ASV193]|uniref:hypothetical protein n=1 Tax=Sphingomonas sp. ASV193 TaxID=3144405 RepID=UPI0032E8857A